MVRLELKLCLLQIYLIRKPLVGFKAKPIEKGSLDKFSDALKLQPSKY
jgi:hypothetical protein